MLALKLLQQSVRSKNSAEIKRLVDFGSRHSTCKTWCNGFSYPHDVCNLGKNLVDSWAKQVINYASIRRKWQYCFPLLSKLSSRYKVFEKSASFFFLSKEGKARDANVQPSINRNFIDLRRQISRYNESGAHFTSRTYISLPCKTPGPVHSVTACIMPSFILFIFYPLKNTLPILYNEK